MIPIATENNCLASIQLWASSTLIMRETQNDTNRHKGAFLMGLWIPDRWLYPTVSGKPSWRAVVPREFVMEYLSVSHSIQLLGFC